MKPGVSIIIPSYNYGHFLPETLKSLQEQEFTDWECWIVDDGSTDSTAQVVTRIIKKDNRIQYIYQDNQGQPSARNKGLKYSSGDYIQFLDSDDLLQPMKLFNQCRFLDQHPETDIVYGDVRYFNQATPEDLFINRWDDRMKEWVPKLSGKGRSIVEAFVNNNILELGSALFRKRAIYTVGDFSVSLQGVEDYDYCFRAAIKGLSFSYLDSKNAWCLMRHHPDSYSKSMIQMFRKELMLRELMEESIEHSQFKELLPLNKKKYNWRLKRLQDLLIDLTIKGKKQLDKSDFKWLFEHSDWKQNLYFFPRILKAKLFRSFSLPTGSP